MTLLSLGCVPKYFPEQDKASKTDSGKPIVQRAERVLERLRGQYVFASALLDTAQADLRKMAPAPDGVTQKTLRLRPLQSATRVCWDEPVISSGRSVLKPYQYERLADAFARRGGRQDLPLVKANIKVLISDIAPCSGPEVDKARKYPRKTTPEAQQWVEDTFTRLHRLRVLANEVPSYWERAIEDAEGAASQVSVLRAKLEKERSNPDTDQEALESHIQTMTIILSRDLPNLVNRVNTASESMETELIVLMESVETLLNQTPFLDVTR
jgi:hypothetical protein